MTTKQKRFCDEYLVDLNGTQAAIRAGYSQKTAKQIAAENLTKPDIKAYIDAELSKIHDETIADATEVMQYLTAVMRGNSESCVLAMCGDGCQEVITKPPDEKERTRAAELIGKRYGMFTEKISADVQLPVVFAGDDDLED